MSSGSIQPAMIKASPVFPEEAIFIHETHDVGNFLGLPGSLVWL